MFKERAKNIFVKYSSQNELYFTADGQAFFDKNPAINHTDGLKDKTIVTITRVEAFEADVPLTEAQIQAAADKAAADQAAADKDKAAADQAAADQEAADKDKAAADQAAADQEALDAAAKSLADAQAKVDADNANKQANPQ